MSRLKKQDVLTSIQIKLLKALAKFKYLTFSQMLKMDIGTTQYQYLWKQAVWLRDRSIPLVGCNSFSIPQPRMGKVESMYFLTQAGKDVLMQEFRFDEWLIRMQVWKWVAFRDYYHRKRQIDFQIVLDRHLKANSLDIVFFDTYFDRTWNARSNKNLTAKTSLSDWENRIIPDWIFSVSNRAGKEYLFAFEMCNHNDSKRILDQIHKHVKFMMSKKLNNKYGYKIDHEYKVLMLFTNPAIMESVYQRLQYDSRLENVKKYFLLNDFNKIEYPDFFATWLNGDWVLENIFL